MVRFKFSPVPKLQKMADKTSNLENFNIPQQRPGDSQACL